MVKYNYDDRNVISRMLLNVNKNIIFTSAHRLLYTVTD